MAKKLRTKLDIQKSIKIKITTFLRQLVTDFKKTKLEQIAVNCYNYVSDSAEVKINDFIKMLDPEEKKEYEPKPDRYFSMLKSLSVFKVYLNNNSIEI